MIKENVVFEASAHRILEFLSDHPLEGFYVTEIAVGVGLSKGAASLWLRKLLKNGLVLAEQRGKELYYKVDISSSVIRQYKVLNNIILLDPFVDKLKGVSRKITLFGSSARGEDHSGSDFDLFIIAKDPRAAGQMIANAKLKRKIQPVIKTASELTAFERENREFYGQVMAGITLWEEKDDD